jgi:glutaredoxin-related protein
MREVEDSPNRCPICQRVQLSTEVCPECQQVGITFTPVETDQDLLDVLDILANLAKFSQPLNATALTMIVTMRDSVEQRKRRA